MASGGGEDDSFDKKLAEARVRHGLSTPQSRSEPGGQTMDATTGRAMSVGLRVGIELLSALVVALGIGWYLDRWLHTSPLFLVVFVLLGGAAGIANVWRVVGPKPPRPPSRAGD